MYVPRGKLNSRVLGINWVGWNSTNKSGIECVQGITSCYLGFVGYQPTKEEDQDDDRFEDEGQEKRMNDPNHDPGNAESVVTNLQKLEPKEDVEKTVG